MKRDNHTRPLKACCQKASGLTLMEVLIAVVILSIGLLGIAGLHFNSLRGNQNALETSVAVALAREGADRIRANLPGVRNPDTGVADRTAYNLITSAGSDPGCITSLCSVANVAATDAFEWFTRLQTLLPGGEGVICRDSTPMDGEDSTTHGCNLDAASDVFAIKVFWDHDRDPATRMMAYRTVLIP